MSFPAIVEAFYTTTKRLGDREPTYQRCVGDPVALAIHAARAAKWQFTAPHLRLDQDGRSIGLRYASPQLAMQAIVEALEAAAVDLEYQTLRARAGLPKGGQLWPAPNRAVLRSRGRAKLSEQATKCASRLSAGGLWAGSTLATR